MTVSVTTVDGVTVSWADAEYGLSDTVLQVTCGAERTTFPLVNLISFTTSEAGPP